MHNPWTESPLAYSSIPPSTDREKHNRGFEDHSLRATEDPMLSLFPKKIPQERRARFIDISS